MPLPTVQWTVTLTPAPAPLRTTLKAKARRWGLAALALLVAYSIGATHADGTAAQPPAPAYTQPATVTLQPER